MLHIFMTQILIPYTQRYFLQVSFNTMNIRVSYHDMMMFLAILNSLPGQALQAKQMSATASTPNSAPSTDTPTIAAHSPAHAATALTSVSTIPLPTVALDSVDFEGDSSVDAITPQKTGMSDRFSMCCCGQTFDCSSSSYFKVCKL
jgi:hypothetical protein